jgi:single-stranded DNA-binding protein
MQRVELIGRLGKDFEKRVTETGKVMMTSSISVNFAKDKNQWYQLMIFENKIQLFSQTLEKIGKGSKIYVSGSLKICDPYQSKEGKWTNKFIVSPDAINIIYSGEREHKQSEFKF